MRSFLPALLALFPLATVAPVHAAPGTSGVAGAGAGLGFMRGGGLAGGRQPGFGRGHGASFAVRRSGFPLKGRSVRFRGYGHEPGLGFAPVYLGADYGAWPALEGTDPAYTAPLVPAPASAIPSAPGIRDAVVLPPVVYVVNARGKKRLSKRADSVSSPAAAVRVVTVETGR